MGLSSTVSYFLIKIKYYVRQVHQDKQDIPNWIQDFANKISGILRFFPQDDCLVVLETKSDHHHHPDRERPLIWSCITPAPAHRLSASSAYLQIRSLQSTIHVLFPRIGQISLLWTGHVVHTSRYNTSQGVEEVRNDKILLLVSFLILQVAESAPDEAPNVLLSHS